MSLPNSSRSDTPNSNLVDKDQDQAPDGGDAQTASGAAKNECLTIDDLFLAGAKRKNMDADEINEWLREGELHPNLPHL